MTRAEIERDYQIVNGIIRSPGKFEGEPLYAPALWDLASMGCEDDYEDEQDGTLISIFTDSLKDLTDEFPELKETREVRIWEDDCGFVFTEVK